MRTLFFFFVLYIGCKISINAQDITTHQWKNRVILLLADSFENNSLREQKLAFSAHTEALKERKLLIYEISPSYYRTGTDLEHTELGASTQYEKFNSKHESFKLVLIGLDGAIKFEKEAPTNPKSIFDLIDQMPMRKDELRNE